MYKEAQNIAKLWLEGNKTKAFEELLSINKERLMVVVLLVSENLEPTDKINFRISIDLMGKKHENTNAEICRVKTK